MSDKKKIIPLEEVLLRFNKHNAEFITNLNREEDKENLGSINSIEKNIENDIKGVKFSTNLKKNSFIDEIKNGLGDEVKKNPNKVKIVRVEKKWYEKMSLYIKKLFTKF